MLFAIILVDKGKVKVSRKTTQCASAASVSLTVTRLMTECGVGQLLFLVRQPRVSQQYR